MPIDMVTAVTSMGVGVEDELMEWWDRNEGRAENFKNATDISRAIGALAGYGMQMWMPRQAKLGNNLATAFTPLLVKSISKTVRARSAGGTSLPTRDFVPRKQQRMPVGQSAKPQFDQMRVY